MFCDADTESLRPSAGHIASKGGCIQNYLELIT